MFFSIFSSLDHDSESQLFTFCSRPYYISLFPFSFQLSAESQCCLQKLTAKVNSKPELGPNFQNMSPFFRKKPVEVLRFCLLQNGFDLTSRINDTIPPPGPAENLLSQVTSDPNVVPQYFWLLKVGLDLNIWQFGDEIYSSPRIQEQVVFLERQRWFFLERRRWVFWNIASGFSRTSEVGFWNV